MNKITFLGAGSSVFAKNVLGDCLQTDCLREYEYALFDIDPVRLEESYRMLSNINRNSNGGKAKIVKYTDRLEALRGAKYVCNAIQVGGYDPCTITDFEVPKKYGLRQTIGDTNGIGGIFRALRTIPVMQDFAADMEKVCPDALFINYTNPMSLCVKTLYYVFPEIKAFGCCHEVFGTQKVLKGILEETMGLKDVKREDIQVNVLGINHFTWFDYASYKGIDLFPIYRKYTEEHKEDGYKEADKNWANSTFECAHIVKFDLFRKYGLIAAAGDRHLVEFMPGVGDSYLKDPETVKRWKFGLTTVDWRKKDLQERLAKSARLAAGEEEIELKPTGEEGIQLIKALCGLTRKISNVNIPNTGHQIANLPESAVVETNAVFERDAIRPLYAGELPEQIKELVDPHVANHERILKAAILCDFDLVVEAFLEDPQVKGRASREQVEELVRDMLRSTAKYLPEGWKKYL